MNELYLESFFDNDEFKEMKTQIDNLDDKYYNFATNLSLLQTTNHLSDLAYNYTDLENIDFSILACPNKKKRKQIFITTKIHHKRCKHKQNKRIHRNCIKYLIDEDFSEIINNKVISRFDSNSRNYNKYKVKIRLFDEDVIVKKIMSNFMKFIRLVLEKCNKAFKLFSRIKIDIKSFFNVKSCVDYISEMKLGDFVQSSNIINLFEKDLSEIFDFFKNSNYFHSYLLEKFKKSYDEFYISEFFKIVNKIKGI